MLQERINESEDGFLSMRTRKGKKFRVQYKGKDSFLAFPENSEANLTGYTSSIEYVRALYMQGESPELYRTMYNAPYVRGMLTYLQEQCGLPTTPPDMRKESQPFVLIIDEINRGNVSRIFGELITLIEPSKRAGREEALEVTLPYSKQPFSVPNNVYLIGTMNTADRSLASLDIALRRRFSFVEMPPRPELLDGVRVTGVNIGQLLRTMNERIEVLLDRDHCLGHAYFIGLKDGDGVEQLAKIFRANILPLLQEYFFEDWQRIQWVLNDHRKSNEKLRFLSEPKDDLVALFGDKTEVRATGRRWRINDEAFTQIGAYAEIIDVPSKPN